MSSDAVPVVNGKHLAISLCLLSAALVLVAVSTLIDAPWWRALCWIPAFFLAFAGLVDLLVEALPWLGFLMIVGTLPALAVGFLVYMILKAAGVLR